MCVSGKGRHTGSRQGACERVCVCRGRVGTQQTGEEVTGQPEKRALGPGAHRYPSPRAAVPGCSAGPGSSPGPQW